MNAVGNYRFLSVGGRRQKQGRSITLNTHLQESRRRIL